MTSKFLTKEEELFLGELIQKKKAALAELEENDVSEERREELRIIIEEGEEAVDTLVRNNVGLVHSAARKFKFKFPAAGDYDDIVQDGMSGLMTAVNKYDPSRGNKFSTMAFYWIAQSISRSSNKTSRLVRLPENRVSDLTKMNAIAKESEGLSWEELDNLVMERLGISKKDISNIRSAACTPASLNKVITSDNSADREFIDFVSFKESQSSEDIVVNSEMTTILHRTIDKLKPVEKDVLMSSYAMTNGSPADVRSKYKIPASKFKKIQRHAVSELKTMLTNEGLTFGDFLDSSHS